VGSDV